MRSDLPERFVSTPCNRWLGLQLVACSAERVDLLLPVRAEFLQEEGVVQGGILTSLADTAAVYLLWPFLPPDRTMTGTGCTMNFLAAAVPGGQPLRAVAVPVRIGGTLAVCESTISQGERLLAKGTFTFLVRERRS
jgi:uncharacterized protein (TIGR00369 family)